MSPDERAPLELGPDDRVVFFTGAGMSAESGVPTYRGQGGIWSQYRYTEYACQEAFDEAPERVWDFHDVRRAAVLACAPHDGHRAIARFQARHPQTRIITQNIDGLHQLAGARDVVELHGSLWRVRCSGCGVKEERREAPLHGRRHACGAYWRPDIVWFGDMLDPRHVEAAAAAMREARVVISIGTSAVVFPAAELPMIARGHGALLIEVNPEETQLSHLYDQTVRDTASSALGRLLPNDAD